MFSTQVRSKQLYYFIKSIKEDFEKIKPFVEKFSSEFIMGLADSEGGSCVSGINRGYLFLKVDIANSANLPLLEYAQELLLRKFKLDTTLRKTKTIGMQDSIIDGRLITRAKDVYCLTIKTEKQAIEYCSLIGFSLSRKNQKVSDFVFLATKFSKSIACIHWVKLYHKIGRYWKRKNNSPIEEFEFIN